jgi:hypothetical protein
VIEAAISERGTVVHSKNMSDFPIFNKSIYGLFDLPEKQEVHYCYLTQNLYVNM